MIDVKSFLSQIGRLNYILIKTETPYLPLDFPDTYPVGKDLDIIVAPICFPTMLNIAKDFYPEYSKRYSIRILEKHHNFRLRFEEKNKLHYQIDISDSFLNFPLWFLLESIENRVLKDGLYYIPCTRYEIAYRAASFLSNRKKQHHLDYIIEHKKFIDKELMSKLGIDYDFE